MTKVELANIVASFFLREGKIPNNTNDSVDQFKVEYHGNNMN